MPDIATLEGSGGERRDRDVELAIGAAATAVAAHVFSAR